jgi:hypothetical protein
MTKLTINNVYDYIEGNSRALSTLFKPLPQYIKEQVYYRSSQCQPCLEKGSCTECGCATPGLFYASKRACEALRWGPMVNEKDWKEFKKQNNLNYDHLKRTEEGTDTSLQEPIPSEGV